MSCFSKTIAINLEIPVVFQLCAIYFLFLLMVCKDIYVNSAFITKPKIDILHELLWCIFILYIDV